MRSFILHFSAIFLTEAHSYGRTSYNRRRGKLIENHRHSTPKCIPEAYGYKQTSYKRRTPDSHREPSNKFFVNFRKQPLCETARMIGKCGDFARRGCPILICSTRGCRLYDSSSHKTKKQQLSAPCPTDVVGASGPYWRVGPYCDRVGAFASRSGPKS